MKRFLTWYAFPVAMMSTSILAHAQPDTGIVPEPGVLALAAIGAVVGVAVSIARKRRK